jgi:DAACS family dicarboxylate/amino acid:cation (Na+ or H+) symporter
LALAPVLILLAIVHALLTAHFERGTAGRLVRLLILNTLVAIIVGLAVANTLKPGRWAQLKPAAQEVAHTGLPHRWEDAGGGG